LFQNEYGKQKKATIESYRGFQTMDSKHHPVVQQGIKAADLISEVTSFATKLLQKVPTYHDAPKTKPLISTN